VRPNCKCTLRSLFLSKPDPHPDCPPTQANFATDGAWKQHVEGPVHRKALQKQEAERVRQERLQQ